MPKKLSELPLASSVASSDTLVVVQGGVTKKAAVSLLPASASFTAPTGTGLMTTTSSAMDAAAATVGAGFLTWAATPSGANLASLLTSALPDSKGGTGLTALGAGVSTLLAAAPTGTAALVGSTSPTFRTSVLVNNPANTFAYTLTPAAIGANRILNLPLLTATDTIAVLALAQTLTSKTINAADNTITDTSATTGDILRHNGTRFVRLARGTAGQVLKTNAGGTDIEWGAAGSGSPGGNSNEIQINNAGAFGGALRVLAGTDYVSIGTTPAAAGNLRLPAGGSVMAKDSGAAQYTMIQGSGDSVYVGTDASFGTQSSGINIYSAGATAIGVGSSTTQYITSAATEGWKPITGSALGSTPWGVHGKVVIDMVSDANYTAAAAEYAYDFLHFSPNRWTVQRTLTMPLPASDAEAYYKTIHNGQLVTMTISNGGGGTKTLATGLAQRFLFHSTGVSIASATFTP